jgi:SAM-dependent MidA family methyltransferase
VEGFRPWRAATEQALYGPDGFFRRPAGPGWLAGQPAGPGAHFRTSVHASPLFAGAVLELLTRVDAALGHPDPIDLVDVGAGRGELLVGVSRLVPAELAGRLRLTGVELAPRPADLPAGIRWLAEVPRHTGLLFANEWLDNVPVDVAELDGDGVPRLVLVEPATGAEALGEPIDGDDAAWLARWWPLRDPGDRAELGRPRDLAWADAVAAVERGLAVAVDYGHLVTDRPPGGTLTGYAAGRQVPPVPDGSCDLTAHVAMDAVAMGVAGPALLTDQRTALRALGVRGERPPRELASTDPAGYLRALASAGEAGELLDSAGLGGFHWLAVSVGLPPEWLPAALAVGADVRG